MSSPPYRRVLAQFDNGNLVRVPVTDMVTDKKVLGKKVSGKKVLKFHTIKVLWKKVLSLKVLPIREFIF